MPFLLFGNTGNTAMYQTFRAILVNERFNYFFHVKIFLHVITQALFDAGSKPKFLFCPHLLLCRGRQIAVCVPFFFNKFCQIYALLFLYLHSCPHGPVGKRAPGTQEVKGSDPGYNLTFLWRENSGA